MTRLPWERCRRGGGSSAARATGPRRYRQGPEPPSPSGLVATWGRAGDLARRDQSRAHPLGNLGQELGPHVLLVADSIGPGPKRWHLPGLATDPDHEELDDRQPGAVPIGMEVQAT